MNRLLLIAIGFVVVAMLGFGIFVVTNRPDPASVATNVPTDPVTPVPTAPTTLEPATPAAPVVAETPATPVVPESAEITAVVESDTGRKRFETWAGIARGLGLTVETETAGLADTAIVLNGLSLGGTVMGVEWRWQSAAARIEERDTPAYALLAEGEQTLSLTRGGVTRSWQGAADHIEIEVLSAPQRPYITVQVELGEVNMQASDGGTPLVVGSAELRVHHGVGAVPPATFKIGNIGLPLWASGPLAPGIGRLDIEAQVLNPVPEGWQMGRFNIEWGALDLNGAGMLGFDADLRPAGRITTKIENPLALVDLAAVYDPRGAAGLVDTYAALLARMAQSELVDVTFAMRDGQLVIEGAPFGVPDIVLGTLLPVLPATP